jgi:dephospho-CoA kinase
MTAVLVGLTGGIGAGKSAAAQRFAQRGAVVVDSDDLAREAVLPGTPGFTAVVDRFGPGVVATDGTLDRAAIAAVVFADDAARADLERIVHPHVRARVRERVASAGPADVVVNAVPLLVEAGLAGEYDRIVVVEAPLEVRVDRLAQRGLSRDEALARIAAQADDDARRAVAWRVIVNDGSRADLDAAVDRIWAELVARS